MLDRKIKDTIKKALIEDIGKSDKTTVLAVPAENKAEAVILAKESGVLCGVELAKSAFKQIDHKLVFRAFKKDGAVFKKNTKIISINGNARSILIAERVALNFLSLLSGISTITREFQKRTKGTPARIFDTRKTTPNLRELEKYAVRVGGGSNHRKKLSDAILIKDNHLRAGKYFYKKHVDRQKLEELIFKLKKERHLTIEIEVENLREFKEVLVYKPDIIMLDNFPVKNMKRAVKIRNRSFPKISLEASGGVNLSNVKKIAATGVDMISVGMITHSPCAIDFSLKII